MNDCILPSAIAVKDVVERVDAPHAVENAGELAMIRLRSHCLFTIRGSPARGLNRQPAFQLVDGVLSIVGVHALIEHLVKALE